MRGDLDAAVARITGDDNRARERTFDGDLDLDSKAFTRKTGFLKIVGPLVVVIIDLILVFLVVFYFGSIVSNNS